MRVLDAEDQLLARDGLTRMPTAHGFDVVATVDDGSQLASEALVSVRPDVAVVDVRLPPSFTDEGLRATIAARREVPGLPVLILSQYVERLYARELLSDSPARSATCSKTASATCGSSSTPSARSPRAARSSTPRSSRTCCAATTLLPSPHGSRTCFGWDGRGLPVASIAAGMVITEKAVSNHINALFAKLGLPPSGSDHRRVLAVLDTTSTSEPLASGTGSTSSTSGRP